MNAPISIRSANERKNDAIIRALKRDHAIAWEHVGGLSAPAKMPGLGYSLPASQCQTGAKLAKVKGSTCHGCYAMRGNYLYPNVQKSLWARLDSLVYLDAWQAAISELIEAALALGLEPFWRWHDSGDVQSVEHLRAIVAIANAFPQVSFWLPTREYAHVKNALASGTVFPANLCVRLSAHMVDGKAPDMGLPVSTVHNGAFVHPTAHNCPAPTQGNFCGDCRACWQPSVPHVSYAKH